MKTVQMGPMNTFKRRATHLALGLGLAATLAFGAVMPTGAEPVTGSVSVNGAETVVFNVADNLNLLDSLAPVVLNGADHTATGSLAIDVTDYMGTGAGWALQISTTGFSATGGKTIPTTGFKVLSTTVSKVNTGAGVAPDPNNTGFTLSGSAQTLLLATEGKGQGDYDLVSSFELAVPADTLEGTYTANIMVDTITGQLP